MQEIITFLAEYADAERSGDAARLGQALTDDFVGVGPLGLMLPKPAWLARHESGDLRYETFELDELHVRLHGDAALVTARHVLLCIAQDPATRLRDVAERVGITERAIQTIVADLASAGYLTRRRVGRRNHYQLNPQLPLRHPLEQHAEIGELLGVLSRGQPATAGPSG
jgi:ketosteroid isomerase-like protein